jgi:hypothetical protein
MMMNANCEPGKRYLDRGYAAIEAIITCPPVPTIVIIVVLNI